MVRVKLYWVQVILILGLIIGQAFDRSLAANDLAVTATIAVTLVVLSYLGKPSETIAEMRHRVFSGNSKIKIFLLTYLLPLYLVLMLLLTVVFSKF